MAQHGSVAMAKRWCQMAESSQLEAAFLSVACDRLDVRAFSLPESSDMGSILWR